MAGDDTSDSANLENNWDLSSDEAGTASNERTQKMSEYERQRLKRIEENKARMEAMGLHKIANSLMGSSPKTKKNSEPRKNKRKAVEEDEEYMPPDGDEELSSSSEGDDKGDNKKSVGVESSGSRQRKVKVKQKNTMPKKRVSGKSPFSNLDYVDDDDDLMQAIALSLQDSAMFSKVGNNSVTSQKSGAQAIERPTNERKENCVQDDTGKRKRKKPISNRVQITEDELVVHFFQFDEAGKESISLRDLRRVAAAHDFTWTDKELVDMIYCFDTDVDGKLSLEDFRKIAGRCNIIQRSENTADGS